MLKQKFLIIFIATFSLLLLAPVAASAQSGTSTTGQQCTRDENCGGEFCWVNGICIKEPKGGGIIGAKSIWGVIELVLRYLFSLAGIVAVVFIIIGGYQYITSAGNEEAAEKGKKTLINAVLGLAAVLLAIAIIAIITTTLGSDKLIP